MVKRKTVTTNNKEIYKKLTMLNYTPEVILRGVKKIQINKILKNINEKMKIIVIEEANHLLILKKINPINYNVYYRERQNKKSC